jgi:hypothetical protein
MYSKIRFSTTLTIKLKSLKKQHSILTQVITIRHTKKEHSTFRESESFVQSYQKCEISWRVGLTRGILCSGGSLFAKAGFTLKAGARLLYATARPQLTVENKGPSESASLYEPPAVAATVRVLRQHSALTPPPSIAALSRAASSLKFCISLSGRAAAAGIN